MTDRRFLVLAVVVMVMAASVGFLGAQMTAARFSDTETKHVSISAGTWTTTPEATPTPPEHAISFVAFCTADGTDATASAVTITDVVRDDEGEPFGISYESSVDLSTVVINGGREFENFAGETSDTVYFGTGTTPESAGTGEPGTFDQMPAEPCPGDETLVVKFDYDDGSGEFVPDGTQPSDVGVRSLDTTTDEADGTDDSNVTTATSAETTAKMPAGTETPTQTTSEPTPTSTPTDTETAVPTETSTTRTSLSTSWNLGNETAGADTDE